MRVCVCFRVCVCAHARVCACACTFVCVYVSACVCAHASVSARECTCVCACVRACVYDVPKLQKHAFSKLLRNTRIVPLFVTNVHMFCFLRHFYIIT